MKMRWKAELPKMPRLPKVPLEAGDPNPGEVGMREITISEHHGVRHRHTMAAAFWIVVGIVAVVAVGDTLALLALVLAIFATAWWICREAEHRVTSNDAWRYVTGIGTRAGH